MDTNSKSNTFLITIPLFYPSGELHLGHAWTSLLADILARFQASIGKKVYFLVGIDEHGSKILAHARRAQQTPQHYVDLMSQKFLHFWKLLNIKYDAFIRTSNSEHHHLVQQTFLALSNCKAVYQGQYQGIYCATCEEFLTKQQYSNGKCAICSSQPQVLQQPSYFLKVQPYTTWLKNTIIDQQILQPSYICRELTNNFLSSDLLQDLSITRTDIIWGITVPDQKLPKTFYVWFDALLGYLSGSGYHTNPHLFQLYWNPNTEIVQIIGKEIVRFHAIYWPIILRNLEIRLPNKIIAHGWITINNHKMSKSLQNIVDPKKLIMRYSADAVRLFLWFNFKTRHDNAYNHTIFLKFYNGFLVNNLGNFHARLLKMLQQYLPYDGLFDAQKITFFGTQQMIQMTKKTLLQFKTLLQAYDFDQSAQLLMNFLQKINKDLQDSAPWQMFQRKDPRLNSYLLQCAYCLLALAYCLQSTAPTISARIINDLGMQDQDLSWNTIMNEQIIFRMKSQKKHIHHLFERIKIKKELQELSQ